VGHDPEDRVEFVSGRLDDRILTALDGLGGLVAFSGLRRVLRAHPESLARALRRLEREGLVARTDGGYRSLHAAPAVQVSPESLRAVASVELGPGVPADAVLGRLAGRWFGDLRWVGTVEGRDSRLLAWARRDGAATVLLGIRGRQLRVYLRDDPRSEDPGDAEDAAYELLVHAAGALRPEPSVADRSVLDLRRPGPEPWESLEN